MRKVWLWLKFPLGIKVVRGGHRGELKDQARDSYSLEGPARQEPTQSLEPPPAHHRAFFFFFCYSILRSPWATQNLRNWG